MWVLGMWMMLPWSSRTLRFSLSSRTTTSRLFSSLGSRPATAPPSSSLAFNASRLFTSVSFFLFTPLTDSHIDRLLSRAQTGLASFSAKGTLLIAPEGINGQFCVPSDHIEHFRDCLVAIDSTFEAVDFNFGNTTTYYEREFPFKKLSVKRKKFILTDNHNISLNLSDDYGREASAEEWHLLVTGNNGSKVEKPRNTVLIDCRNDYESDIGAFEGAVPLNTKVFSDSWEALDSLLEGVDPTNTTLLTYCTGGIRCRKTNAYLRQKKGFKDVVSLKHGIIGYERWVSGRKEVEKEEIESAFKGRNYLFDRSKMEKQQQAVETPSSMLNTSPQNNASDEDCSYMNSL